LCRQAAILGLIVSTHSRLKAAGETEIFVMFGELFQHTAA